MKEPLFAMVLTVILVSAFSAMPERSFAEDVGPSAARLASEASSPGDLLDKYRAGELITKFGFWRGQDLFRAGRRLDLGYFGGGSRDIFAGSPGALESMDTFRLRRIAGTTLYIVGFATLLTAVVLTSAKNSWFVTPNDGRPGRFGPKPLFWMSTGIGMSATLAGAIVMTGANTHLSVAVDRYNSDLVKSLRGVSPGASSMSVWGIEYGGKF